MISKSINILCKDYEKIENYDKAIADIENMWECHHRMETVYTREELIKYELYYNCEPHQLIFLTKAEHRSLHHKGLKRQPRSDKYRRKQSESHKGQIAWNKGISCSDETKKKISEANRGKQMPEEAKTRISNALKGRYFSETHRAKLSESQKGKKLSEEHKAKLSDAFKGRHWKLVDGHRVWY